MAGDAVVTNPGSRGNFRGGFDRVSERWENRAPSEPFQINEAIFGSFGQRLRIIGLLLPLV
jgi:hypothetical protein